MVDDGVRSMAGEEMKLLGGASGPVPEELEVVVQVWVSVVEGVQVEDVNALAFVEHQGETPVKSVVVVEEADKLGTEQFFEEPS